MKILLIEPFYGRSHKQWVDQVIEKIPADFCSLTLKDNHWKWRMQSSALHLAEVFLKEYSSFSPDLVLSSSMLDVLSFKGLTFKELGHCPFVTYFHENQFAYPISKRDTDKLENRDAHYAFLNLKTALGSDHNLFNSQYNLKTFIEGSKSFLKKMPSSNLANQFEKLSQKCRVLPLGFENQFKPPKTSLDNPIFVWNHRWEYDKNPEEFFETLKALKNQQIQFQLIVLGTHSQNIPPIFQWAKDYFRHEILHFGMASSKEEYFSLLEKGNVYLVTSKHDFFGISVIEAIMAGLQPILPERLAYPEHIPQSLFNEVFYQEDSLKKTQERLKQPLSENEMVKLQKNLSKYLWKDLSPIYENLFKSFLA